MYRERGREVDPDRVVRETEIEHTCGPKENVDLCVCVRESEIDPTLCAPKEIDGETVSACEIGTCMTARER